MAFENSLVKALQCVQTLFIFSLLVGSALTLPLLGSRGEDLEATHSLKDQLSAMLTAVDQALDEYIVSEMDCSTVEDCRTFTSSLSLTALPTSTDDQGSPADWNAAFEKNINGLQDFNYILQNTFNARAIEGQSSGVDGMTLSVSELLRDVANLLSQFVLTLETDLEGTFCLDFYIKPLSSYPPCKVCKVSSLPSNMLEVVRNYQFMMQLYGYLGDFSNFYNKFLFLTPVPESC